MNIRNTDAHKITAVDFFSDLTSRHARRRFFGGFIAFCVACIAVNYMTSSASTKGEYIRQTIVALTTEMLSGAIIILFAYALYFFFIGENREHGLVTTIRPNDIGTEIKKLPFGTSHYSFWGRSGSYFRSVALLKLDEESITAKRTISVHVLLPDPRDENLLKAYSHMQRALGEYSDADSLLCNVVATTTVCAIIAANNRSLDIKVYYSKFLPAFRIDLSEQGALLTRDDPKLYAMFCSRESEFYEMYRLMIHNEMILSHKVDLDLDKYTGSSIDDHDLSIDLMSDFGIDPDRLAGNFQRIMDLVNKRPHRYSR